MKTIKLLALLFISSLAFTGCSDDDDHDDDDHDHGEEVITTVIYTLTDADDNIITLTFEDADGDGGEDGVYTISGSLTANTEYSGAVTLQNVTDEDDADHIQEEIEEEGEEHEFFYTLSDNSDIEIVKTDYDDAGDLLGFKTTLTTGEAGTDTITVTLIHEPTKPNDGLEDAGGSTDIEVTFAVTVENTSIIDSIDDVFDNTIEDAIESFTDILKQ